MHRPSKFIAARTIFRAIIGLVPAAIRYVASRRRIRARLDAIRNEER